MEEPLKIINLSLSEANDLASFLQGKLAAAGWEGKVEVKVITEERNSRGLAFPVPPHLILSFVQGVAIGLGSGAGKFLFDKLREWATKRRNINAKLVSGQAETPLQQLPPEPPQGS